jgi:WD40 repeat protein
MRRMIVTACLLFISLSTSAQELPTDPNATLLAEFGRGEVKSVGWSPDGESVWVGTSAGTWELDADLNERRAFPDIRYGALSPDGTWLAGYSETGFYALHDLENDRRIDNNPYQYSFGLVIDRPPLWSPDSQWAVYSSYGYLHIIHPAEFDGYTALMGMSGTYQPLIWSESGRFLAGYDGQDVWVLDTQSTVRNAVRLPNIDGLQNNYLNQLTWFGDEALYWGAVGDGGDEERWRWNGEQFVLGGERSSCSLCLYSPDGQFVLTAYPFDFTLLSTETQEIIFERQAQFPEGFLFWWGCSPFGHPIRKIFSSQPTSTTNKRPSMVSPSLTLTPET